MNKKYFEILGMASLIGSSMSLTYIMIKTFNEGQACFRFMKYAEGWIEIPLFMFGIFIGFTIF